MNSCKVCICIMFSKFLFGCSSEPREKDIAARQIGTYVFDISRTELGGYKKDANIYRNLEITFKQDSTFTMNIPTPFFADTVGTWVAGDGLAYSYNQLFFKNKVYTQLEGTQFFPPYLNNRDTVFLINGASPRKGQTPIEKSYFKKLRI